MTSVTIDGRWYPYLNWRPYCLRCSRSERMTMITPHHFRCACGASHVGGPPWLQRSMDKRDALPDPHGPKDESPPSSPPR